MSDVRLEEVEVQTLSTRDRDVISAALVRINNQVFKGCHEGHFLEEVFGDDSAYNHLALYYNNDNNIIGYCSLRELVFAIRNNEKEIVTVRSTLALLPGYHGKDLMTRYIMKCGLRYLLKYPHNDVYFFELCIHPAAYYGFAKFVWEMYPHCRHKTCPKEQAELISVLCKKFNITIHNPTNMFHGREEGWVSKQNKQSELFWQEHPSEHVKYYFKCNPTFGTGDAVITLVPISLKNFIMSSVSYFERYMEKRAKKLSKVVWK